MGHPDLAETIMGHRFVIAPPGLPNEISGTLVAAFRKAMSDPEFVAWTKKSDIPLDLIFGEDADKMAKKIIRLYQVDLKPTLLKYLQ